MLCGGGGSIPLTIRDNTLILGAAGVVCTGSFAASGCFSSLAGSTFGSGAGLRLKILITAEEMDDPPGIELVMLAGTMFVCLGASASLGLGAAVFGGSGDWDPTSDDITEVAADGLGAGVLI